MNRPASQNRWPNLSATVVLIASLTLAACAPAGTPTTLTTARPATLTSSATPTTASPAAEDAAIEIATSFIEAFFSFDVDLAATYLAPDADLSSFEWDGATWQMGNRLMEAQGWKVSLDTCQATGVPVLRVTCPFAVDSLRSDEMGLGPFGDNTFDVTVEDGQIVSAAMQLGYLTNGFDSQVWGPFSEWIVANHPEDGPVMYANWPNTNLEALTDESIALWEQRSIEYVEYVATQP